MHSCICRKTCPPAANRNAGELWVEMEVEVGGTGHCSPSDGQVERAGLRLQRHVKMEHDAHCLVGRCAGAAVCDAFVLSK